MDRGVGDDAPSTVDLLAAGFELRFDEQHHRRPRLAQRDQRRDHERSEMNDRSPTTMSTGPPICSTSAWRTLERSRFVTRSRLEPFVELAVADVERDDVRGTALQQAVGETTGRGADIERSQPATSMSKTSSA